MTQPPQRTEPVMTLRGGRRMGTGEIVAGLIGIALLGYLAYTLLFPEKF